MYAGNGVSRRANGNLIYRLLVYSFGETKQTSQMLIAKACHSHSYCYSYSYCYSLLQFFGKKI